jgi:hypothetical protein
VFCAVTGKSLSQFPRKYYDLRFRGTVVAHRTEPLIKFMTKEFGVPRWATPPRLHHLCPLEKTKGNEANSSNGKYISMFSVIFMVFTIENSFSSIYTILNQHLYISCFHRTTGRSRKNSRFDGSRVLRNMKNVNFNFVHTFRNEENVFMKLKLKLFSVLFFFSKFNSWLKLNRNTGDDNMKLKSRNVIP